MSLRDLWHKVVPAFTPLERRLLGAVEEILEPAAAERFRRQLDAVNLVQRHGGSREVCLYRLRGGRPRNDPALQFADRRREAVLARLRFHLPDDARRWTCELILVDGFVFSFVFEPAAEPVQKRTDVIVDAVELVADPMRSREPLGSPPLAEPPRWGGWLAEWARSYPIADVTAPLPAEERQQALGAIPAMLPREYLQAMEQTDGFRSGEVAVLGLSQVYEIVLDDARYQVLAQVDGEGVLAVENGDRRGELWFLPFEEGEPRRRTAGFRQAVEERLRAGVVA